MNNKELAERIIVLMESIPVEFFIVRTLELLLISPTITSKSTSIEVDSEEFIKIVILYFYE